jgi:glycosyltransferase involved in cell wall biosynthesis
MKLVFVHQYLGALGGAETDILLTATHLHRRGYDLALLYESTTGRNEDAWRAVFSQTIPLAQGTDAFLKQFHPDLVYLNSVSDLDVLETLVRSRIPLVRRVHDHRLYCLRGYKYNYFTREICKRPAGPHCVFPCLAVVGRNHDGGFPLRWASYAAKRKEIRLNQRCARFVTYSEYQKEELVRNGFASERIHIHVPIRCRGTETPVSTFGDRNLVLFAGQIIRGKGVDLLLRALAKVKAPFESVILGDGNHRPYCERLSRQLGLSDRVHFQGFVEHERMKDFFLQASLMVVSSVWPEPFALVGQEAMSYGVPVVAFDAGGIREWLIDGENGFLVPWMDTSLMAARIEALLCDKDLARRLGRRGMELGTQQYDAERQIDALESIFLDVAAKARRDAARFQPAPIDQPRFAYENA